ncbi:FAD-dependent oxidoreductase [Acidianus sulfidivorans JP7]|uniref:FAD-dependent oxidoreductase n=1 Tax=Acidianus sulfidivorans JP7 TaxID=619593 RepID=A0A2U9IMT0_9CREN|nr:FAD-binding oxidoreductase [Acidianus sulfidivorans]AWR97338.1 FAD-dependent oxidoreductase [Acidianus sulfidivorans JP7]
MIIIGAGAHGLSIAYHLLKKDIRDVRIIEQNRIGYGSSGRNASRYRYHFYNKNNVEFAIEGIKYLHKEAKELTYNPLLYKTGYLWILDEQYTNIFKKLDTMWGNYNVKGSFLNCNEFKYIKIDGPCYFAPQDGAFHHDYIIYSYYEEIKNKYNMIISKVSKINIENNKVKGVILDNGSEIIDDTIIVTAGAWSGELLKTAKIDLPIYPEKKEIYITEDVKFKVKPLIIDFNKRIYFSQTLKGEIIGGVEDEKENNGFKDFTISVDNTIHFLKSIRGIIKDIDGIGILRGWSGYYEMTPDHSHIMGYSETWPEGLYIDAGYSGHGMMFAPFSGKIMADLIADERKNRFIEIFSPDRFKNEKLVDERMVI